MSTDTIHREHHNDSQSTSKQSLSRRLPESLNINTTQDWENYPDPQ